MPLRPGHGFGRWQLYDDAHESFRESGRRFLAAEILPQHDAWERDGIVLRSVLARSGELSCVGMAVDERYGGAGAQDFRFNAAIGEEVHRAGVTGFGVGLTNHSDVCLPYLLKHATEKQRERWLPGVAAGQLITAIAMAEPGTGSDLAALPRAVSVTAERRGGSTAPRRSSPAASMRTL